MDRKVLLTIVALLGVGLAAEGNPTTPNPTTQPPYQPQPSVPPYVPHQTYPYADGYGTPYQEFLYPVMSSYPSGRPTAQGYIAALIPAAQAAMQVALKVFAKVGLFVMGAVTLLLIGGIFTTAVCSLTPICTISFAGLGGIDKDSMRSLMTPDRISAAATLIQDAIGKYQRLQRMTGN